MKYVDASAVLRVLFVEPGPSVPLLAGDHVDRSGGQSSPCSELAAADPRKLRRPANRR